LVTRPTATPDAVDDIGIPASSNAKLPPQTVAIEEEPIFMLNVNYVALLHVAPWLKYFSLNCLTCYALPFDSKTLLVNLMVKGKSFGIIGRKAFSARAPCPISRRLSRPIPVSLVAYDGNS